MKIVIAEEKISTTTKPVKIIKTKKIAERKRQNDAKIVRFQIQHVLNKITKFNWLLTEFRKMICRWWYKASAAFFEKKITMNKKAANFSKARVRCSD